MKIMIEPKQNITISYKMPFDYNYEATSAARIMDMICEFNGYVEDRYHIVPDYSEISILVEYYSARMMFSLEKTVHNPNYEQEMVAYKEWLQAQEDKKARRSNQEQLNKDKQETLKKLRNERIVNNIKKITEQGKSNQEIQGALEKYLEKVSNVFLKKDIDTKEVHGKLHVEVEENNDADIDYADPVDAVEWELNP